MGAGFLIASVLVFITEDLGMYTMFAIVFGAVFLLCFLIMLILQVAYGGGLPAMFTISHEGVSHHAGKEIRALDRFSLAGSAAGGSAGGSTAAGLIAASQEDNTLRWDEVRYIRVYKQLLFIELRSKYLISPVALYCTAENFPAVLDMVKRFAPASASIKIH
jgi:hypothetical protein